MATLGTRIKKSRENIGMSQSELATAIGIKPSSGVISNWERDLNKPDAEKIVKLCEVLNISASFLLDYYGKSTFEFSPSEIEHIKKYRFLDDSGKNHIEYELKREVERIKELHAKEKHIAELEAKEHKIYEEAEPLTRTYTYFGRIACAGSGFYFDDIPTETIEATDMGGDFIIGVNGDSMEPDYHDGDLLYVAKTEHISHGDVGIFTIGNECFLKEYGENGLISRNKDYDDIPGTEDVRLIGKVIKKVEIKKNR